MEHNDELRKQKRGIKRHHTVAGEEHKPMGMENQT